MTAQMPRKNRDDSKVEMLLGKKFEASAKMADANAMMASLKAEIAKINKEMMDVGASIDEIKCL